MNPCTLRQTDHPTVERDQAAVVLPRQCHQMGVGILAMAGQAVWISVLAQASYAADTAWVERVDRFWIEGTEYRIECNGGVPAERAHRSDH